MMRTAVPSRLAGVTAGLILLVLAACTGSGTAIEELPTLTAPEPTSTPRPVATRPPTAVPTEVPATPTVEPTATSTPAPPTPTPIFDTELPPLIVEGLLTWPPGAATLDDDQAAAVNAGVSFWNVAIPAIGMGPGSHQVEFDSLRPHLSTPLQDLFLQQRDGLEAVPAVITKEAEPRNRVVSMQVGWLPDGTQTVALCFNFDTSDSVRGQEEATTVFSYVAFFAEERWTIGTFDIRAVDSVLRECSPNEMEA